MKKLSDFGIEVKIRLLNLNKTQNWLIEEVKKDTGLYFDDSYLHKILIGVKSSEKIVNSIKKILELEW